LTGAQRHCAAWRTLTSTPRGALPLRVRVERNVRPRLEMLHDSRPTSLRAVKKRAMPQQKEMANSGDLKTPPVPIKRAKPSIPPTATSPKRARPTQNRHPRPSEPVASNEDCTAIWCATANPIQAESRLTIRTVFIVRSNVKVTGDLRREAAPRPDAARRPC
jgi:hypothetical protein